MNSISSLFRAGSNRHWIRASILTALLSWRKSVPLLRIVCQPFLLRKRRKCAHSERKALQGCNRRDTRNKQTGERLLRRARTYLERQQASPEQLHLPCCTLPLGPLPATLDWPAVPPALQAGQQTLCPQKAPQHTLAPAA